MGTLNRQEIFVFGVLDRLLLSEEQSAEAVSAAPLYSLLGSARSSEQVYGLAEDGNPPAPTVLTPPASSA